VRCLASWHTLEAIGGATFAHFVDFGGDLDNKMDGPGTPKVEQMLSLPHESKGPQNRPKTVLEGHSGHQSGPHDTPEAPQEPFQGSILG